MDVGAGRLEVIVGNADRLGVVTLGAFVLALAVSPAAAAPWKWRAGFTDESSARLSAIHYQIHGSIALPGQEPWIRPTGTSSSWCR